MSAAGDYQLGVDLGTTWTAAAVARDGHVRMVGLGNRAAAIPSVVHKAHDGTTLTGDAADRRGPSEPLRVAREFKRRLGDPTPVLLGGTPYSAEALLGTLLDAVVTRVTEREGGPPSHLTVTHPANWGQYKIALFEQSVQMVGAIDTTALTEPEAAAMAYAANERVEPGALVAVYDLGGGTFDTAILRKTNDGFAILGQPTGIERLGGIDFDEAVVGHVRTTLGAALDRVDPSDPAVLKALTRLRRECIDAKEALSSDTEATIPVLLPGIQTEIRLTRGEFESMIRPTLHATVDAMRRTMTAAAVELDEISTVLLVGGSSRIPLVAELVSESFGRPLAVDAHPKHAVALGAARAAALAVDDTRGDADEARVLPFAITADGTGPVAHHVAEDETIDLTEVIAASISGGSVGPSTSSGGRADAVSGRGRAPGHGGLALAERPTAAAWDLGPYDDIPDETPDWLVDARDEGNPTRRRLLVGLLAFVALSLLAIGAGAFISSEPRSEAFGDTPTLPVADPSQRAIGDDGEDGDETGMHRRNGPKKGDAPGGAGGDGGAAATGDAAKADDTTATGQGGAGSSGADDTAAGAAADGGATAPKKPATRTPPADDADPAPQQPPEDTGGGDGASEPTGGGGGAPPDPDPAPDPPADDTDVSQQTPGATEGPVTSPAAQI